MIYLLTAVGLTPGGSSTVHIYTQTIHKEHSRHKQYTEQHNLLIRKSADRAPSLRGITLAFALQLRKKHAVWGKTFNDVLAGTRTLKKPALSLVDIETSLSRLPLQHYSILYYYL